MTFLPNVIETLRARIEDFDAVFVITNQSGIEKGTLTPDDSNTIIAQVDQALHGKLTDFWSSPRTASAYRKPNPGMFLGLADKHYIDLAKSTMVGDSDIDRQAAKDAGIATFIWAKDFFKWEGHDGAQVETLTIRSVLHKGEVFRQGNVIVRDTGSWTPSVHDLLRHLEEVDFPAPRIVGSGLDENDRETLTYIPGDVGWDTVPSHDSAFALGEMIRRLHQATATFTPPPNAVWYPWCGRSLGESDRVIGHCDIAPWNIICHNGMPVALIDWDFAGPTDARAGSAPSFTTTLLRKTRACPFSRKGLSCLEPLLRDTGFPKSSGPVSSTSSSTLSSTSTPGRPTTSALHTRIGLRIPSSDGRSPGSLAQQPGSTAIEATCRTRSHSTSLVNPQLRPSQLLRSTSPHSCLFVCICGSNLSCPLE